MPTDADAVSNGSITTINNSGVIVGPENNIQILIDANQSVIQNNVSNRDIFAVSYTHLTLPTILLV